MNNDAPDNNDEDFISFLDAASDGNEEVIRSIYKKSNNLLA